MIPAAKEEGGEGQIIYPIHEQTVQNSGINAVVHILKTKGLCSYNY